MIMNLDGLGHTSKRNVLRVLQGMEEKGLIKSQRKEFKMWTLCDNSFGHWEHRLLMNRFLVENGLYKRAIIEPEIELQGETFRPDFMIPQFEGAKSPKDYVFYEVDRRQKRKINMSKVDRYKKLGLRFEVVCAEERAYMWKGFVYHIM